MAKSKSAKGVFTPLGNDRLGERVRASILEAILEKRFTDRLPPEDELVEMLNVSRTTVRTALQSLEQDGVINRRRAIGTTINPHFNPSGLALQRLVGFDRLLREHGYSVKTEIDWHRGERADFVTGSEFDTDLDCLLAEKSYFANGALAIYVRDAVPWSNLTDAEFTGSIPASIFEFSEQSWATPVNHTVAELIPVVGEEKTKLPVADKPFIRLHERHYSNTDELVALSDIDVNHDYVHFEVFRRL